MQHGNVSLEGTAQASGSRSCRRANAGRSENAAVPVSATTDEFDEFVEPGRGRSGRSR